MTSYTDTTGKGNAESAANMNGHASTPNGTATMNGDATDMREECVDVSGCPTHVLKCGQITNDFLILIVPGNPGVATYYEAFMRRLHCLSRAAVWCVSHAGHVNVGAAEPEEDFHSLSGQVRHKQLFIEQHVPTSSRLLLIGHSIGCYIILHLLAHLPPHQVLKCMMLFPTVERMALSEQGRVATPTLRYLRWLAPIGIYPFSKLPESFILWVLRWYFRNRNIPECTVKATQKLVDAGCIRVIANMGNDEMQNVVYADYNLVEKYLDKLMFYYGANDHWCPVEYYEDMKAKFVKGDITLCEKGFDHAFVLESSVGMAEVAWEWMQKQNFIKNCH